MTMALLVLFMTPDVQVEHRHFSVSSEGRSLGTYSQTIKYDPAQNEYEVTTASDVHVKVFIVKHDYVFRGNEKWAFGYLQTLQCETVENGVKRSASADLQNKYDWTSSYWTLPRKNCMDKEFSLLDLENGQTRIVRIALVGKDANGDHYQLTGKDFRVELWYDGRNRLVRREMARNGRWTIIQKTGR